MRSLVRTLTIYSRASVGLMVTAVTMERKAEWEGGTGISLTLKQHTQNPRALRGLERENLYSYWPTASPSLTTWILSHPQANKLKDQMLLSN